MNIGTLYTDFIRETGRRDITAGEVFFNLVDKASDHLDRMAPHDKSEKVEFFQTVVGVNVLTMSRHRAVKRIYVANNLDGRTRLQFKTLDFILLTFAEVPTAESSRGRPTLWTKPALTLAPDQDQKTKADMTTDGHVDLDHILFHPDFSTQDYHHGKMGILIFPVPDAVYTVEVVFDSYEARITDDNQENYWSANYDAILMNAIRRELEVRDRNFTGRSEYDRVIRADINEITIDKYYAESSVPFNEAIMNG